MIKLVDYIWSSIAIALIGFLTGALIVKTSVGSIREITMVEFNLAHYHEKTKEFVADSLEFKNDTIIIRKKSN